MIGWLFDSFIQPLHEGFVLKAMLGGSIVAVVCGVVGCLVVLKRMAFLGDALSHSMIAGVAGGYLFMKMLFGIEAHAPSMLLGSLLAALLTVVLIGFVSKVSRIKEDSAIGIMYCGVFASGAVMVSTFSKYVHIDIVHFIMGDILGVADADLWIAALAASMVLSMIILFFRHFQLAAFDPVMAASIGLPVVLIDYALTACVSMVVVSAISMVGVILVVGLLITPAATAYLLTDRLKRMMFLAALFGVSSVVGGIYLCLQLNSSGGAAIMVFCTVQFLVVLTVAPRYGLLAGWIRRVRAVPQDLVEDILRAVLKGKGALARTDLNRQFAQPVLEVAKALRYMLREELILEKDGKLALTEKGHGQARRVMRAHRLWESYLEHVGTPQAEIDRKAHQLEHIYEEDAVDYLDHKLGHPLIDPHGSEIPEDFVHIQSGEPVTLSLLRRGLQGRVVSVLPPAQGVGLQPGQQVMVKGRAENGKVWLVEGPNGQELKLDHETADAVMVQVQIQNDKVPS